MSLNTVAGDQRPYFPMLLGNGNDHVLIGYTGAMGGGGSHEQWIYDHAVLTGWFKSDRRGENHRVMNLIQCGYVLTNGLRAVGIDHYEQRFDPQSATLITQCRYGKTRLKVQTRLTQQHQLIHQFDIKPATDGMCLQMFIKAPNFWWASAQVDQPVTLDATLKRKHVDFTIQSACVENLHGQLTSDASKATAVNTFARTPGICIPLDQHPSSTVSLQLLDQQDKEYQAKLLPLNKPAKTQTVIASHDKSWRNFHKQSSVKLPKKLQQIYDTSQYVCCSHQHPITGGIPAGAYPLMWHSDINAFDMAFSLMTFTTSNHRAQAKKVLDFWKQALPVMQQRAASVGLSGACAMSSVMQSGVEVPPLPKDKQARKHAILDGKHFVTAHAPIHVWQVYQHTGDPNILREYWDVMAKPMAFLMNHVVIEEDDMALIIRSSGPNGKERVNGKSVHHRNPTRSLQAVIEAIKAVMGASDVLGITRDPCCDRLLPKLIKGIERNRKDGIIGRNDEMPSPHADPCLTGLFNAPIDRRTFKAALKRHRNSRGFQYWEDHGYASVPWLDLHAAATFLRLDQTDQAIKHMEHAAGLTTSLNAFPEGVRPDGVYWKTWYATVHGAFAHAINILFLRRSGNRLAIFHGVPAAWGDVSMTNLCAPVGLQVRASRQGSKIKARITNESPIIQSLSIHLGGANGKGGFVHDQTLKPQQTVTCQSDT